MKRLASPEILLCLLLLLSGCVSSRIGGPTAPADDPGAGVLTLSSGRSYPVYPRDLAYSGTATYQWPDGRLYRGQWVQGLPEGQGNETLPDGEHYRGAWHGGRRHGHGELKRADGSRYVGDFVHDLRQGSGVEISSDGTYRGGWHADVPEGRGSFTGTDGASYQGDWFEGKRSGHGVYTDKSGNRYEGEWLDDKPNGFGTMTDLRSGTYSGGWEDGRQSGYGQFVDISEVVYEGTWVDGRRQGFGVATRPDGSRYEGEWLEGRRHGRGRESFADGSFHEGDWEFDQVLGPGTRHDRTGIELSGFWNGDRLRSGMLTLPTGARYAGSLMLGNNDEVSQPLIDWLTAEAGRNDPYAQFFLGTVFSDFRVPAPDPARAQALFEASATAGLAEAQFRLALGYTESAPNRSLDLLRMAAEGGQAQASALLGENYLRGRHVPVDIRAAISYLQEASEGGDLAARNNLAWILATSAEAEFSDPALAIALIRPIALLRESWRYEATLAAAYAADGKFDAAVATQKKAIDAARDALGAAAEALAAMRHRLDLYQQQRPYREPRL
ncbi:MAG: hypothetical protein R3E82_12670 [Pseudomonadales bacterium]